MNRPPYPSDPNNTEWQPLEPLLPLPKPGTTHQYPRREIVNAIHYMVLPT